MADTRPRRIGYFAITIKQTGLWCDTCLLPSVVEGDLVELNDSGVTLLSTAARVCVGAQQHPA